MAHQGPATLGIALVALSEELGISMAHRALEHLLQYGEPSVRCPHCVPSSSVLLSSQLLTRTICVLHVQKAAAGGGR